MHTPSSAHSESLAAQLRRAGAVAVVTPADATYDQARTVYFTGYDRRPAAIVAVRTAEEVARALRVARDTGSRLSVRNGGHSPAGHGVCDGGIVIDVRALRSLEIDAAARVARAGAGIPAGEYTAAASAHGLATGFGDAPTVAVGGITLAGGIGFLHRKYGMTIDQVLAAEVVTADGGILRVDEHTHPDLFWAIRGGGGNFGVVTRIEYRLQPVDRVYGGMLILPATPERVVGFVRAAAAAPEELSMMINVAPAPPLPFVPSEHHGRPIIMAMLVYAGDAVSGERALAPFRALAPALVDGVREMQYAEIYHAEGGPPQPAAVANHTRFVDDIDTATAEALLEGLARSTAMMRVVQFRPLGGAVARVAADATAFAHRARGYVLNVAAMYGQPQEAAQHEAWATSTAALAGTEPAGAYVGFLGGNGAARIREAYPEAVYERLAAIKRRYDPDNLFRHNHNIAP